jgi:hypothetical protein
MLVETEPNQTTDAIALGYAAEYVDPVADRLLRQIVAWMAIIEGGAAIVGNVVHVGLALNLLSSPPNMSWEIDRSWNTIMMAATALTSIATLIGGLMLLRRIRASIVLLRVAGISTIACGFASTVLIMITIPGYAAYWSTFGAATVQSLDAFRGLWTPAMLVLLTLPPLAKRMVG